jgi:(R,R)-butanediol dehydrogenase/meso-butanediol dehydrogenase/diacetyl reductase
VKQGELLPGENVVVVGFGMIGAAAALMARAAGAGQVFVLETSEARRELALTTGMDEASDPRVRDVRRELAARTAGVGVDLVIDCSGKQEVFAASVELSRRGGRIAICGLGHEPATIDLRRLVYFERKVVGVLGYRYDHQPVLSLLAGRRLDVSPLLGEPIPLADIVEEGFQRMVHDPSAPLRVPVQPAVR